MQAGQQRSIDLCSTTNHTPSCQEQDQEASRIPKIANFQIWVKQTNIANFNMAYHTKIKVCSFECFKPSTPKRCRSSCKELLFGTPSEGLRTHHNHHNRHNPHIPRLQEFRSLRSQKTEKTCVPRAPGQNPRKESLESLDLRS